MKRWSTLVLITLLAGCQPRIPAVHAQSAIRDAACSAADSARRLGTEPLTIEVETPVTVAFIGQGALAVAPITKPAGPVSIVKVTFDPKTLKCPPHGGADEQEPQLELDEENGRLYPAKP